MNIAISQDRRTLTVRVPMKLGRRGRAKAIIVPAGAASWSSTPSRIDSTLIKALARAHRWKRLLDGGKFASLAELAKIERINPSYVSRVLQLTLLAPDIVEAILNGRLPTSLTTADVLNRVCPSWADQRRSLQPNFSPLTR